MANVIDWKQAALILARQSYSIQSAFRSARNAKWASENGRPDLAQAMRKEFKRDMRHCSEEERAVIEAVLEEEEKPAALEVAAGPGKGE